MLRIRVIMNNSIKTLIVVILYNKEIRDSLTINSLNISKVKNTTLHIINNGPNEIKIDNDCEEFILNENNDVEVFNFLNNRPLSIIYNEALNNAEYDRYILFDDDSVLSDDFFHNIDVFSFDKIDLQLPRIVDRKTQKITYPRVHDYEDFGKDGMFNIPQHTHFYSIGSGLVIYKKLVSTFHRNSLTVFDERFALYGVDLSLFRRIDKLKRNGEEINAQINSFLIHSLSSTSEVMTDWRYKERLYDRVLSIRFYSKNKFRLCFNLGRALLKELIKFNFVNLNLIIMTFFRGKHPRC